LAAAWAWFSLFWWPAGLIVALSAATTLLFAKRRFNTSAELRNWSIASIVSAALLGCAFYAGSNPTSKAYVRHDHVMHTGHWILKTHVVHMDNVGATIVCMFGLVIAGVFCLSSIAGVLLYVFTGSQPKMAQSGES